MHTCRKWRAPCIAIGLSLFLAGCQPAEVGQVESDLLLTQPSDASSQAVSVGLTDSPSETVTSQEEGSSASTESSTSVSSTASSSSMAFTSAQSNPNSAVAAEYTYRPEVARQMEEVDPSNPPDTINVLLTAEASDIQREYTADYFPGCDVTVSYQGHMGGNTTLYPDGSPDPNNPYQVYFTLKINQPGFDNFEKVVQYLDQRQDIATIGITFFEIID